MRKTIVAAHSFGYVWVDEDGLREIIVNIIRKQDPLPCSVTKTFTTLRPRQSSFELTLMENEATTDIVSELEWGREIGVVVIDLPPALPAGSQIDVTFELDDQGRLHIEALHALSGIRTGTTIQTTILISNGMPEKEQQPILRHTTAINKPEPSKLATSMLRIFVSHSHRDAAFCQELVVALRAAGANVWYDEHNMGSGQLTPTIERELRARSVFIVILSPSAIQSQWVAEETLWAYNLYRSENTRTILPVLAAPVNERDIWLFLQNFKRIELPGGQPYPKAEAIGRIVAAMQAIK